MDVHPEMFFPTVFQRTKLNHPEIAVSSTQGFSFVQFSLLTGHVVVVPPQILHFDFGDQPINTGDAVFLTCSVNKGDLPVHIEWYLNEKSAENLAGIAISNTNKRSSQLSIDSVSEEHVGGYTCTAENVAGSATYSTALDVNG